MKGRVLVVDDDEGMLNICERLLSGERYSVTLCASVAEAAVVIRTQKFDLLLTDYMLGDGYGTKLISLMKILNPETKALMMTGSEELAGTRGPGPDLADAEVLIKPFPPEKLLQDAANLLQLHARQREKSHGK
ncbi:MAG TPA: response regulator [Elusimicrobiales bacterium]|nr:response regulator [Elusimicrobiales bacterium]